MAGGVSPRYGWFYILSPGGATVNSSNAARLGKLHVYTESLCRPSGAIVLRPCFPGAYAPGYPLAGPSGLNGVYRLSHPSRLRAAPH